MIKRKDDFNSRPREGANGDECPLEIEKEFQFPPP